MGDDHPKRKMKTPSQLEILERVYAEDKYPSEIVRSELSHQLNLTDRQVKMWFCHRRLKDRKGSTTTTTTTTTTSTEETRHKKNQQRIHPQYQLDHHHHLLPPPPPPAPPPPPPHHHHPGLSLDFGSPMQQQQPMRVLPIATAAPHNFLDMMHPEERAFHMRQLAKRDLETNGGRGSAYRRLGLHNVSPLDCRLSVSPEVAAIRLVEEQLGEPMREDGPILGYEFDPLPPGAFDTPIEHGSQYPRSQFATPEGVYNSESKAHARHEPKLGRQALGSSDFSPSPATSSSKRKNSSSSPFLPLATVPQSPRVPHEHQFIPEHPTGTGAHFYDRSSSKQQQQQQPQQQSLELSTRISPLSFLPPAGVETFGNGFCTESRQAPTLGLGFPPPSDMRFPADFLPRTGMPFPPPEVQLLPPVRPPMSEKAIAGTERLIMLHEQEQARLERKRKAEEARIAKEHEAQDKRMKKEMERQEAMRRKKEDQERKESEKVHREKQKELERLAREKAREEERLQRQHKKEYERMEKLLQKENQRVAKLRQKEEMRREKEATKLRAAYERATAKKLAKLSTGLIDDEQLELMQMGAFVQGLISGSEFDPNKIELPMFPPASVRMKPPIGVPPWNDSNHNVANLFMVWRMLTNFADVIGLWPFTLDEFVQALHDYDSRLLGEIHIALLKTLVKDVKDASQAAAIGSNQALAVASGGHPELVEAAYAWGFDIQEWGQHVNALTWPEILRQFALASGYGPRWKKKITETAPSTPVAEGKNAEDAVANLRSGAAAANAVTQMRGRNSSRVRKQQQQHKPVLTPGTVKFAAFQVLSVEGSKGLTILEVVDRVQKAGLRDLSTSKTPEASISAVLSRDTKLFERVAPSTYCVRLVFRKSPEEAEAVLQAAREKIRQCESRLSDAEPEPLEEDIIEEAEEREEEEECDEQDIEETEEREVKNETATTTISTIETTVTTTTTNDNSPSSSGKVILRLKVGKLTPSSDAPAVESGQKEECVKAEPERLHSSLDMNVESVEVMAQESSDGMEIDESQVGEVWVQGLMEGEYTDLSVEERLCGLVALVDAVNQGSTVRSAIEERYEAASALKRQLWEEVQIDKRRLKEECSKAEAAKVDETNLQQQQVDEKPLLQALENGSQEAQEQQLDGDEDGSSNPAQALSEDPNERQQKCASQHSDRSRADMKADIRLRAEKLYVIRSLPLGLDRRHNRYWQFVTSSSGHDPGCRRIYFESHEDGHWEVIDTEEALNALMNSLDIRGTREANLFVALKELEGSLRQAMSSSSTKQHQDHHQSHHTGNGNGAGVQAGAGSRNGNGNDSCEGSPSSSAVVGNGGKDSTSSDARVGSLKVELGRSASENSGAMERYKDMERWLWRHCSVKALQRGGEKRRESENDGMITECESCHDLRWAVDKHCPFCHSTGEEEVWSDFSQHVRDCEQKMISRDPAWRIQGGVLPPRIQLLKKLLFLVEICIPCEALKPAWSTNSYRKAWCQRLKAASSAGEILQAFMDLEGAIDEDWISSSYESIEQVGRLIGIQRKNPPWIPQTSAAVALRLMVFDSSIAYTEEQKQQLMDRQRRVPMRRSKGEAREVLYEAGSTRPAEGEEDKETKEAEFNSQEEELPPQFYERSGGDFGAHPSWSARQESAAVLLEEEEEDDEDEDKRLAMKASGESDDSSQMNWEGQDSFEELEQPGHGSLHHLEELEMEEEDGLMLEEEEELSDEEEESEEEEFQQQASSSDTDEEQNKHDNLVVAKNLININASLEESGDDLHTAAAASKINGGSSERVVNCGLTSELEFERGTYEE
ncbi:homeobox-DDT domain protein RLT1 isoform X3 [Selaginella moellendorffii]|uniref:homeobox-DDT domain protein RLT1 isoform X3 n=1 Tax=Selaginella moellendorffii TaxID=88036 RepID=UPI000D1C5B6F|nr:homeobox-DDT domain protein RLT1 isoform X3 [Selaginella moellendorffii]|eukprot:XP_024520101.1 homeobox-DDT domain protein RLT1 isoform X3 [Selaginella moellendorffii]